jgi:hypothetical protein
MLIERASSLFQAEEEKKRDPSRIIVLQTGQQVSMHALVELRKGDVREAKQYLKVLGDMLVAEKDNLLENFWSDETLKSVPNLTVSDVITKLLQNAQGLCPMWAFRVNFW